MIIIEYLWNTSRRNREFWKRSSTRTCSPSASRKAGSSATSSLSWRPSSSCRTPPTTSRPILNPSNPKIKSSSLTSSSDSSPWSNNRNRSPRPAPRPSSSASPLTVMATPTHRRISRASPNRKSKSTKSLPKSHLHPTKALSPNTSSTKSKMQSKNSGKKGTRVTANSSR